MNVDNSYYRKDKKMKYDRKRILFFINTLDGGGAEKILLDTVKLLDKTKYDIEVKTLVNRGVYIEEIKKIVKYSYVFDNRFRMQKLNRLYYSIILRISKLLSAKLQYKLFIRNTYDVEIAFMEGASTKILSASKNNFLYAWVHVDLIEMPDSCKAYILKKSEGKCYKKFKKIFCVSTDVETSVKNKFHLKENTQVQLNVLDEQSVKNKALEECEDFLFKNKNLNFISIGRLSPQKNYLSLIEVMHKMVMNGYYINLYILGDGLEKKKILQKIGEYNLDKNVKLLGFKKNPYKYLKACDAFVCSSLTEGFSTVVSEAVILEVPIITTKCAGMYDILGDSKYGYVVDNSEVGLYNGLVDFTTNKDLFEHYQTMVKKRSRFFSKELRKAELENILDGE